MLKLLFKQGDPRPLAPYADLGISVPESSMIIQFKFHVYLEELVDKVENVLQALGAKFKSNAKGEMDISRCPRPKRVGITVATLYEDESLLMLAIETKKELTLINFPLGMDQGDAIRNVAWVLEFLNLEYEEQNGVLIFQ